MKKTRGDKPRLDVPAVGPKPREIHQRIVSGTVVSSPRAKVRHGKGTHRG